MAFQSNKGKFDLSLHNLGQIIDDFFSGKSNLNDTSYTGGGAHCNPYANVSETAEGIKLELAAPGLQKENFSLVLEKDILLVEAKEIVKKSEETVKIRRKEFNYSTFSRSFRLDTKVFDVQAISSKYEQGILTISIPFRAKEAEQKQRIEVL
jgi:HSP20 family protein